MIGPKQRGPWPRKAAAAAAAGLFLLAARPAQAEVHALVMGFDNYSPKIPLEGSRNDAADISSVLRRRGVTDITVLDERSGTRADVERAWAAMSGRAQPGDVLFVSFSGHGNRVPEIGEPKHHPDGFEKGFLLPRYDETKFPEEQLRDEHLYDLFKAASDRGLKVIFVADACHSGATVRAVSVQASPPKFQRFETHGKALPPPPPPDKVARRPPIAGLTIYSAADESQQIQEFLLDDQKRGALSYALSRGLEGKAAEADGRLTVGDLGRYLVTNVRALSNNTQIPSAVTPEPDLALFVPPAAPVPITKPVPPPPAKIPAVDPPAKPADRDALELTTLALYVEGQVPAGLDGTRLVDTPADAALSFRSSHAVFNAHGDRIADGVTQDHLQDAVDAARLIALLAKTMGEQGGSLSTSVAAVGSAPSDRYYVAGERIKIQAENSSLPYLTVFDLTANGTVQFLWPTQRYHDPVRWDKPGLPNFDVDVSEPYGQDTLVFIESDRPLSDLHATLEQIKDHVAPRALFDALKLWLPHAKFKLGLQSVFTCSKLMEDGTCATP